jgi:phage replication O-like protein O
MIIKIMNSYTKIPNNYLEWLSNQNFDGVDFRILLFVFRKTIGWNKESDKISISQFMEGTGACRRSIINSIKKLVSYNALVREKDSGKTNTYRLVQSNALLLVQSDVPTSALGCKKLVQSNAPTIYNTKETNKIDFSNFKLIGNTMVEE